MEDKIREIIKENFERNKTSIPWDGMYEEAVKKIMKLIAESA